MANILQYLSEQTRYYNDLKNKIEQQRNQPNVMPIDPRIIERQNQSQLIAQQGSAGDGAHVGYSDQEIQQRNANEQNILRAKIGLAPLATPELLQQQEMQNRYNSLRGLSNLDKNASPEDIAYALRASDPKAAASILFQQQQLKQNKDRYADQSMYNADKLKLQKEIQNLKMSQKSTKAPTEDQAKAAGWYAQAQNAYNNMLGAMNEDKSAATPGVIESLASSIGLDGLANFSKSDSRQKFSQAASSFSEAALRAATGAGVTKDEAEQKIRELTPQITDSEPLKRQKLDSLNVYLSSLQTRAGGASALGDSLAAPMQNQNMFDSVPDPRQYSGKVIRDSATGQRLKSDGNSWVRM
jgi:hypothetical protein